ncbi:hypothetical protein [Streptomyces roseolus]|uniref:hypothetical protein n=1 Tax=Streptomyces roseolus TaxID=67358 RepID=UPI001E2F0961|nr:hypothetical protein [Streptomyces roseolus]
MNAYGSIQINGQLYLEHPAGHLLHNLGETVRGDLEMWREEDMAGFLPGPAGTDEAALTGCAPVLPATGSGSGSRPAASRTRSVRGRRSPGRTAGAQVAHRVHHLPRTYVPRSPDRAG